VEKFYDIAKKFVILISIVFTAGWGMSEYLSKTVKNTIKSTLAEVLIPRIEKLEETVKELANKTKEISDIKTALSVLMYRVDMGEKYALNGKFATLPISPKVPDKPEEE